MDNKVFVVAKREFLERVRSKWFVIMTLLVPVLMAGAGLIPTIMLLRSGTSTAYRHITIIDATGVGLGSRIAKAMMGDSAAAPVAGDTIAPRVETATASDLATKEQAAVAEVMKPNHIAGYLVLTDSTLAGQSARYAGRNASSISDMDKLTSTVRQENMMMRLEREGVRKDIIGDLATNRLKLNTERLNERGRAGTGFGGVIVGLVVGVMLLFLIIFHGQNILRGVLEEKSTRVAEIVISSVKPEALLTGKVLGVGAVGLVQQIAWLAIGGYLVVFLSPIVAKAVGGGAAAAGAAASSPVGGVLSSVTLPFIGIAILYFIVGFVFYATLYAAAGSMVNSEQEAQQAAIPVMLLIMSTWIMVNPVLASPNGTAARVLSWLPWSSPIIMPMRMGLTSVSPIEVGGSILVAILGSVAAMWLSARIYRVGMLMYGKKPGFAEVVKWIRYA
jgi:ABC-2 type transport system permease protein